MDHGPLSGVPVGGIRVLAGIEGMWFMLMSPSASCSGLSSVSVSVQEVSVEVEGEGVSHLYSDAREA